MKVKVNRNNTNWLSYLGITSIISGFIFFLGFVIFVLSIVYTVSNDKNNENSGLGLNLICYYYSLIIMIIEVFSCVYLYFNLFYWILAYRKSIGKRKRFNSLFIYIITPLLILLTIDSLIRLVYVMAGITKVSQYYGGSNPFATINFNADGAIFGNFSSSSNFLPIGNFGFNVVFLLLGFGLMCGTSLFFYYKQKEKFVSEERENSSKEVRANYRSLEMEKMKRKLSKQKTKDLSRRIKAF